MLKYKSKAYTLCPAPEFDVAGTELWLEEMAAKGYILRQDGFHGDAAAFDIAGPQKLKYRLDAAPHGTGMFSRDGGEPDPEQVELSREMGWEYIAKRSDFFIYVSDSSNERELHTDPQIHAMALKAVRNRQIDTLVSNLLWLLVIPLCHIHFGIVSFMVVGRTWFVLLLLAITLATISDSVHRTIKLRKVRRQILENGFAEPFTDLNKTSLPRRIKDLLQIAAAAAVLVVVVSNWNSEILGTNEIPIENYTGDIPFATMEDFLPDGKAELKNYSFGNTVRVWKDILSPVNIIWEEISEVEGSDGRRIEGGLDVNYSEAVSEFIASALAKEAHRYDKREKHYSELEIDLPGLDYCAAYTDELHFPVVIMQKDNIYVRARLYQTGNYKIGLQEWAEIIYNSVF